MIKEKVQKFGKFLSGMVMPNIGAFIAWGLITALFIETGWFPNEQLASLVDPMLKYLLPLLVGYTGGRVVGDVRGGVIGAIATAGVIVGADIPMFIGAMIMGPLAGYTIKKFDKAIEGKAPAGFEMLINNFSVGIIGLILAIVGFYAIGPVVVIVTEGLKLGVEVIISKGLLPLVAIFIEPAKVLFLNNAINHGIIGPIGIEQTKEFGQSIMYLLEANPGPGLGVLLAYCFYSKGGMKQSAPGAAIIHALGGIHEIYFPYVLMNPLLIIAPIVGSAAGILVFSIFNAGLVATPSPGSIFALMALAPKGGMIGILAGVAVSTAVSFVVAAPLVRKAAKKLSDDNDETVVDNEEVVINKAVINKIVFACDAGMGSSAMGATKFRNRIKGFASNIIVINSSVDTIPADADIVVSHKKLAERARKNSPQAEHVFIENFLQDSKLDKLYSILENRADGNIELAEVAVAEVAASAQVKETSILKGDNIILGLSSESKEEAIERAGKILVKEGYVNNNYIAAMQEREKIVSTYIGMGIAIPHGVGEAKKEVEKSGIVVLQYPDGVVFGDDLAYLVIGIAGVGDDHLEILSNIATSLEDEALVDKLKNTSDKFEILKTFNK
ncbi:PTS mannitol transporter subunit IICBA [Clostridium sp. 1001271B_151109_B4]|uniref:PTS mannitol transporter subunit IICBA n=1 Tax=Clostridium sp. 1001271B_151109_B4 TaxID=2787148 RepID=UPI0018A92D7F|nr:PTS mannitol transporter subunit IICBA [Clostridium sp. 1001271B_151109_B4]